MHSIVDWLNRYAAWIWLVASFVACLLSARALATGLLFLRIGRARGTMSLGLFLRDTAWPRLVLLLLYVLIGLLSILETLLPAHVRIVPAVYVQFFTLITLLLTPFILGWTAYRALRLIQQLSLADGERESSS